MIKETPQNYLLTLNSILKKHKLNPDDILWISRGKLRILYQDFVSYVRSNVSDQPVSFEGILVVSEYWLIDLRYIRHSLSGGFFEWNVNMVTSDNESEYNLFRLRNELKPLVTKDSLDQFFYDAD